MSVVLPIRRRQCIIELPVIPNVYFCDFGFAVCVWRQGERNARVVYGRERDRRDHDG